MVVQFRALSPIIQGDIYLFFLKKKKPFLYTHHMKQTCKHTHKHSDKRSSQLEFHIGMNRSFSPSDDALTNPRGQQTYFDLMS